MLKIHKEFLGSEVKISQQPIKKIEDLSQDESSSDLAEQSAWQPIQLTL